MKEINIEDIVARLEQLAILETRHTARAVGVERPAEGKLSLIHISEPTRRP